jgi:hypothetical protein
MEDRCISCHGRALHKVAVKERCIKVAMEMPPQEVVEERPFRAALRYEKTWALAPGVPPLPSCLIQHDAPRNAGVQRLHLRSVRDGNQFIYLRHQRARQSRAFTPNKDRRRPCQPGLIDWRPLVRRGRNQPRTLRLKFARKFFQSASRLRHDHWESKYRPRRGANHFRIEWTHGALTHDYACAAKGLRRPKDRPKIPRILQPHQHHDRTHLESLQHIGDSKFLEPHQRRHALRCFARYRSVEQTVGKQQRIYIGADLRQQTLRQILRRLLEEYGSKAQPAANRFFHNTQSLDRAVSIFRPFGTGKRLPQFLDQRIVAALNSAEPLLPAWGGF